MKTQAVPRLWMSSSANPFERSRMMNLLDNPCNVQPQPLTTFASQSYDDLRLVGVPSLLSDDSRNFHLLGFGDPLEGVFPVLKS